MKPLAALTGGTGFLGRHSIRALHAAGWRVRILARSQPNLPELKDVPLEIVLGGLTDQTALDRLAIGADAIVHIAGLVKATSRAAFMHSNADGAAAMATAWRAQSPDANFVLVSSMAAREPELSHYAASKRAGEDAVRQHSGDGAWRVLRPGAIYGPHDEESLKVLKLANSSKQLMLNAPDARVAMIDVRDAAQAVAAAVQHPTFGTTHELTDARTDGYTWRELAETAATALGRTPRLGRVPAPLLKTVGLCGGIAARLTGSAEMLTSAKVREILHTDWSGDPDLVMPSDQWQPTIGLGQGLSHMANWAQNSGRL
ncbi:MAG: NAD-dependent epimerase/dehydratase family protein [Pikeienuella sp.]